MFSEIKDYEAVFKTLINKTADYLTQNNIKAQILGISGGIDSTVCAAICHEVSKQTGIPLIGRSLPTTNNKTSEVFTADLVGKAFCNDYKVYPIDRFYHQFMIDIVHKETGSVKYIQNELTGGYTIDLEDCLKFQTPIANGNIQARLRMIYLYNLASIYKGLVIDTDNRTENRLGYWTLHGDVGDFKPIGDLWKTEVFKLAEWLFNKYKNDNPIYLTKAEAIWASLQLKPTAGLGITSNDLEELGAESYEQVDGILQEFEAWQWLNFKQGKIFNSNKEERDAFLEEQQMLCYPIEVIISVIDKYYKSTFKRMAIPLIFVNELV